MRRQALSVVTAVLVLLASGCCRERDAALDDAGRFVAKSGHEFDQLVVDIERYAISHGLVALNLPLDADRFLEWRRREWWALRNELAFAMSHEWRVIERMTKDVARYYGYNVQNFPRLKEDILEFFAKAPIEWRNLVEDIVIFQEYRLREMAPLRADLMAFYNNAKWEFANLEADTKLFLEWREREYRKLIRNGRDWFAANMEDWDKLLWDVERFHIRALVEGELLLVDFRNAWSYEVATVPRLIDGVWRFTLWRERELAKLSAEVKEFTAHARWELDRLTADIVRFKDYEANQLPKLMLEVERFFQIYEREVKPLNEDVKRFWRTAVASRKLMVEDLKNFFRRADEERYELQADLYRFVAYGSKEWDRLKDRVKRFATCAHDPVFGDGVMPSPGFGSPTVFNDHIPVKDEYSVAR